MTADRRGALVMGVTPLRSAPVAGHSPEMLRKAKKKGYGSIWYGGKTQVASRVLCEIVNGPAPSNAYEAAHSCGNGDKGCMNPKHLRWALPAENQADRLKDGTHNRGDMRRAGTKLTVEQVVRARKDVERGRSPYDVAETLGVKPATVYNLVKRQTWAWV